MSAISPSIPKSASPNLRHFDVRRDLPAVADLVEMCFRDTIDSDGERYLKQMRATARNQTFLAWLSFTMGVSHMPSGGFVWEQDGRVVGNLSLIPFSGDGFHHYLIANVAVHPDYRGRGIARALTARAVSFCRQRGVPRIWLQVRQDNATAVHIYTSLGFGERTRRTSWFSRPRQQLATAPGGLRCAPLAGRDWPQASAWLSQAYPRDLTWQLPLRLNNLRPGVWGSLYSAFSGAYTRAWGAYRLRQLQGVLGWQALGSHADMLWFAAPSQFEDEALAALLPAARAQLNAYRTLNLDYPAGRCTEVLDAAGFHEYQTLIWMALVL